MSTVACYSRKLQSIRHPLTRPSRPAHPFAEGINPAAPTTLTIKGIKYIATTFSSDEGTSEVRLAKQAGKGEVYDDSRGRDGLVKCDCPSYVNTYEGTCKHGTAVVEADLIKAPKPVANRVAVEPTKLATVAEVATTTVKPAVRIWTEADWKRAEYFKLHPPKGQTRPRPVVVVVEPVVVEPTTIKPMGDVPAEAQEIEVTSGLNLGRWTKRELATGFVWVRHDGQSLDDLMSAGCADHLHHTGKVRLTENTFAKPVTVRPSSAIVATLDEVWYSAFRLGRAGVDAMACSTWVDAAKLAFMDGLYWGSIQRDADHEEDEGRDEGMNFDHAPVDEMVHV